MFIKAYEILDSIYNNNEYVNIALNKIEDNQDRAIITKIVYGVLENNTKYDYYIDMLTDKKPRNYLSIVLKMGFFACDYLDSVPDYAVVEKLEVILNHIKKKDVLAFLNAVIRKYLTSKPQLPSGEDEKISIEYSIPLWVVKIYKKQYGKEKMMAICSAKKDYREHLRVNTLLISCEEIEKLLTEKAIQFEKSVAGGYLINNNAYIKELFNKGFITFMSISSMLVCYACKVKDDYKVLDMCSAPGGKSIFLYSLASNVDVNACDIHSHRIELIKKYANRMNANINAFVADATQNVTQEKYDLVLCDVPCSGLGVANKKPDIYLNSSLSNSLDLFEIQYKILNNGIENCKIGGHIVYSTCTTLREENYNVVGRILKERNDIELEKIDFSPLELQIENKGTLQLLQDENNFDGFFIARLKKIK